MEKVENSNSLKLKIISFVALTFIGYLCIGFPLAVLPIYIHKTLGFSELITGVAISIQYLTTFFFRGYGGKIVDRQGPKLAVKISMSAFAISGVFLLLSFRLSSIPLLGLIILMFSRLITGIGEGLIGASPINWAMLVVGDKHTATAISFNGIASYGALAIGAPLGVISTHYLGIESLAIFSVIMGVTGLYYSLRKPDVKQKHSNDSSKLLPFFTVFRIVLPYGLCLGLAGIGFGGISNFITLYFDFYHWGNAALCLTLFSIPFIIARVFFAKYIDIYGGLKVGLMSVITELIGLMLIFFATTPTMAILGSAISGLGFSLVFPAFGVVAVNRAPSSSAGIALAGYGLFIDISLGVTGPLAGASIRFFGMPYLFAFCSVMVGIALILNLRFLTRNKRLATAPVFSESGKDKFR